MSDDSDQSDLFGLLFGYIVYREIRDGRLDADGCARGGCLFLVIGALLGGLLLVASLAGSSHYSGSFEPLATPWSAQASVRAPAPVPTVWQADPPTPAPTTTPVPVHKVGERVALGDGWTMTIARVERWRPASYREPGWHLLTVYVKLRMPAEDLECVLFGDFSLEARSGRTYETIEWPTREPNLIACSDYHRPTSEAGWVTLEVRDDDAKGLVLIACVPGGFLFCDSPVLVALP